MSDRGLTALGAAVLTISLAGSGRAEAREPSIEVLRDWKFYNNGGHQALLRGDYALAEYRFGEAIGVMRPYQATDARLLARTYHDLAQTLYYEGRFREAEPLAAWALAVREKGAKVPKASLFQSLYLLGMVRRGDKRFAEAEPLFRRALTIQEAEIGADHYENSQTMDELAGVLRDQGKYAEAERFYRRSLAIRDKVRPETNPDLAETAGRYAVMLRRANRAPEAEEQEARAAAIRDALATREAQAAADRLSRGYQGVR